ncbi:hypothetical protein [Leifsonia sp. Root227]|uniref:hypothetical protein n=1 Tax=Leifsonia sp. Root227 TaxID=1736496 RepID=UPI000A9CA823|nr:hypothetical protein [Leifsonia sp. Root227]
MISSEPRPDDPWPPDMRITIEDRPSALLELLWIREAHGLQPHGDDLPPLLSDPPALVVDAQVDAATRVEWERGWPQLWQDALTHAGADQDPALFDRLLHTADGSSERAELLRQVTGPYWSDLFGTTASEGDASSGSYGDWLDRGTAAYLAAMPTSYEEQPERRDLPALIPAWRRGLTKIVVIPCTGDVTRTVGGNALLVTAGTRADSGRYRRALGAFG